MPVRSAISRPEQSIVVTLDTSAYDNAMNSLGKRNSLRDDYNDFQKGFEGENLNAQPGNNLV